MNNDLHKPVNTHGIDLEYNALRSEILKRIELRQQFISITLTLAGVFLGFGLTTESVALIYPPIAAFLALAWAQNDRTIQHLAKYIREKLETLPIGLGFETYVQQEREKNKKRGARQFAALSHVGIFLFTQLMAVGIELSKSTPLAFSPLEWGLLSIDLLSILIVIWIVSQQIKRIGVFAA